MMRDNNDLAAAKSQANYLFEGEFRRRPIQNLAGASQNTPLAQFIQQAAEQRRARDDLRRRQTSATIIQAHWRAYKSNEEQRKLVRSEFDRLRNCLDIENLWKEEKIKENDLDKLFASLFLLYQRKKDTNRLMWLSEKILVYHATIKKLIQMNKEKWLYRISRLLQLSWNSLLYSNEDNASDNLKLINTQIKLLQIFTENSVVNNEHNEPKDQDMKYLWKNMIGAGNLFGILRKLIDTKVHLKSSNSDQLHSSDNIKFDVESFEQSELARSIANLLNHILNCANIDEETENLIIRSFLRYFYAGPWDVKIDKYFGPYLAQQKPRLLHPMKIVRASSNDVRAGSGRIMSKINGQTHHDISINQALTEKHECENLVWLCCAVLQLTQNYVVQLRAHEALELANLIRWFMIPARYLSEQSLLANEERDSTNFMDDDEDFGDQGSYGDDNPTQHIGNLIRASSQRQMTQMDKVISQIIEYLNSGQYVDTFTRLLTIKKVPELQRLIDDIAEIGCLMLTHKHLAVFNCRFLHTLAFNAPFLRSLWSTIINASTPASLFGGGSTPQFAYAQLSRGTNLAPHVWPTILPHLNLFCSLFSYLLLTLEDAEFYSSSSESQFFENSQGNLVDASQGKLENPEFSRSSDYGLHSKNSNPSLKVSDNSTKNSIDDSEHLMSCDDDEQFKNICNFEQSNQSRLEHSCKNKNEMRYDSSDSSEPRGHISSMPFDLKTVVKMCAILRDISVGLSQIMYQDYRAVGRSFVGSSTSSSTSEWSSLDVPAKLFANRVEFLFNTIVHNVRRLYLRDSRRQFCPDGHWISPNIVLPSNRRVEFRACADQRRQLFRHGVYRQQTRQELEIQGGQMRTFTSTELRTALILQNMPFTVSFHDRVQILHALMFKDKIPYRSDAYHFGLPEASIQALIRRNYIYEDAFEKLSSAQRPDLKPPLRISLVNAVGLDEAGIDGGGVFKEFLGELLKTGFDPNRGFFKCTHDNLLYPNPCAPILFSSLYEGFEAHYEFLGRMLGKAIYEKIMVELPFASFFLSKLLATQSNSDVDIHHLASLDPILHKNLVYLKNYQGDVSDLGLDFTIVNNDLGENQIVELKPNGSKIPVTSQNRIEYVHLVSDYRLNKQIRAQCSAFKRGLSQLLDLNWVRMFDPRELQILISGAPTSIDLDDLRRHTHYSGGYSDTDPVIQTFWRVVKKFDENQKRKFLKFVTSCSLPPLLGFKDLVPTFCINPAESNRLPSASTCMNLLKLPRCEDESTMKSKLIYSIEFNSGFELS